MTRLFCLVTCLLAPTLAWVAPPTSPTERTSTQLAVFGSSSSSKLSPLPPGLSPFEKSTAKSLDVQATFRQRALPAVQQALKDGVMQLELEFPPLFGGDQSKTQFDDFDNVQELNANRDWCVQFLPSLMMACWLLFPDDKECELAKQEWTGQRYRQAAQFTSLRAALEATGAPLTKAWGTTIASLANKVTGGDGILADTASLDELDVTQERLHVVCQPGNGGPVEDWINVEQLHRTTQQPTMVVNGALDKVRDGYYPAVFFPALAKTVPFYQEFDAVFFLKPITDKGVYGWVYRVYPEPWQVILQTPVKKGTQVQVQETVALVTDTRPSYEQAVQALLTQSKV